MHKYFFLFFSSIFLTCCTQKKIIIPYKEEPPKKNEFFPVTDFIRGQLSEVDSLPVTPMKIYKINDEKADSVWLKRKDIRPFCEPFLHPEIDSIHFANKFTVSSFLDKTINAFTFSYDPAGALPDSIILRNWNIYVDPETGKVSRIYIVKKTGNKTIQLTWNSGKGCNINTITDVPGKSPIIKDEKMIWDFD